MARCPVTGACTGDTALNHNWDVPVPAAGRDDSVTRAPLLCQCSVFAPRLVSQIRANISNLSQHSSPPHPRILKQFYPLLNLIWSAFWAKIFMSVYFPRHIQRPQEVLSLSCILCNPKCGEYDRYKIFRRISMFFILLDSWYFAFHCFYPSISPLRHEPPMPPLDHIIY